MSNSKLAEWSAAVALCRAVLRASGAGLPQFTLVSRSPHRRQGSHVGILNRGSGEIRVNLSACHGEPPGEHSVTAVTAHEATHHWHLSLGEAGWRALTTRFREVLTLEAPVSAYGGTSPVEAIAEAGRVMILEPERLRRESPLQYAALAAAGLRSPGDDT